MKIVKWYDKYFLSGKLYCIKTFAVLQDNVYFICFKDNFYNCENEIDIKTNKLLDFNIVNCSMIGNNISKTINDEDIYINNNKCNVVCHANINMNLFSLTNLKIGLFEILLEIDKNEDLFSKYFITEKQLRILKIKQLNDQ